MLRIPCALQAGKRADGYTNAKILYLLREFSPNCGLGTPDKPAR